MVTTAIEHDSVLQPAHAYRSRLLTVDAQGVIAIEALRQLIDDQTVLISVMYANNEIGTIQPLRQVTQLVAAVRRDRRNRGVQLPLYVHSDACQAANYLDIQVARLGVDLLTLNGGKLYGPKQSGVLYVKAGLQLQPLIVGGGQEFGLRSGTENVAQAVGFARALALAQTQRHGETKRLQAVQQTCLEQIASQLPAARVNGSLKHRLPNNVHLTLPGQDNERLLIQLDTAGILAAAGSACSASDDTPSHVLRAIGCSDADARASLRLTFGRTTTDADVTAAIGILRQLAGA